MIVRMQEYCDIVLRTDDLNKFPSDKVIARCESCKVFTLCVWVRLQLSLIRKHWKVQVNKSKAFGISSATSSFVSAPVPGAVRSFIKLPTRAERRIES